MLTLLSKNSMDAMGICLNKQKFMYGVFEPSII